MNQRNNHHLILFPLPFQGHINPMLQLGRILCARGFSITILHTNFNAPDPSSHPHFTFRSIGDSFDRSEAPPSDIPGLLLLLNTRCASPFEERLQEMMSSPGGDSVPVACLISDSLFSFACDVAERLKLLAHASGSQSEEAVTECPPLLVRDIPGIKLQKPEMALQLFGNMIKVIKSSPGVIFNTFEELEHPALMSVWEVLSVPDFVSFGSVVVLSESKISEIALGLADSEQPFLWVVRPGVVCNLEWLQKSPSHFLEAPERRGKTVKWAPQMEELAHPAVGAFWTHSGWNSTLESISEGVPMLCMPFLIKE
ncbi:UDP-glycosyltransferase 76F1-like [Eucalyptus grandis]|uniref:UDP-glycosyltransferase 76F1-like n=1 Tax=Eucalyptus grandis TaxID=71139 RepID=UPI00192EA188|nr:UDP-glycosyltransferase 76F1-like [Eucalyptus grandis]